MGKALGRISEVMILTKIQTALDSWLTLGLATKKAAKTYFGVLKSLDTDGSVIVGSNNDGGSAVIPGGLLSNSDPLQVNH